MATTEHGRRGYDRGQAHGPRNLALAAVVGIGSVLGVGTVLRYTNLINTGGSGSPDLPSVPTVTIGDLPSPTGAQLTDAPTGTPPPTESPTPSTGYHTAENGNVTYKAENGNILNVPNIPGLTTHIEEGRLLYRDTQNAEAGEFKPNVFMAENQTGGVVLRPSTISELMQNQAGLTFAIPVDISEAIDMISVSSTDNLANRGIPDVEIKYDGDLPVPNIIPQSISVSIIMNQIGSYGIFDSAFIDGTIDTNTITPGEEIRYVRTLVNPTDINGTQVRVDSPYGSQIVNSTNSVAMMLSTTSEILDLSTENILNADGVPVFMSTQTY